VAPGGELRGSLNAKAADSPKPLLLAALAAS